MGCVFTPKIPKTFTFPQIAPIIQGILLTFLPKKVFFFLKMRMHIEHYFDFFAQIIQCVFTPKISKKLSFLQILTIIQGTLSTFLQKKVIFCQNATAYRALF